MKKSSAETPAAKKRAAAIGAYTEKFGGTEEENAELLEKYTAKEIAAMCAESAPERPAKTPRPKQRVQGGTGGKKPVSTPEQTAVPAERPATQDPVPEAPQADVTRTPGKVPSAEKQNEKDARARERAVRRYTKRFGGAEEENALLLKDLTAEEILKLAEESPKPTHTPKPAHTPKAEREKNDSRSVTRKEAVRRYTEAFGGTDEKNNRLLKGLSVKDILKYIQSGTPYSPLP